jgi:prolyl-tRNA editing enzyme YbaK/EbsC (Cys-tRNA(Pro) deacylase)
MSDAASDPPPASLALDALAVLHRIFVHPGPVTSLEQAAIERGQRPEQVVRSLLFRLREGAYALVLVAGPGQLSWKALRGYLGQRRVSTASPDEVLAVTGYRVGAVAPVGLRRRVRLLVDGSVLAQDELSIGSGVRGTALLLTREALLEALGPYEGVALLDAD